MKSLAGDLAFRQGGWDLQWARSKQDWEPGGLWAVSQQQVPCRVQSLERRPGSRAVWMKVEERSHVKATWGVKSAVFSALRDKGGVPVDSQVPKFENCCTVPNKQWPHGPVSMAV